MAKQVLIVDDNKSDQLIAQTFLEKSEMIVTIATDGFEALDLLTDQDQKDFHLLVVDLQMPRMSGLELIKRIRRLSRYQKIPILVMSARQETKDVKMAVEFGASDYSVKPLDGLVFSQKANKLTYDIEETWAEYHLNSTVDDCNCKIQQTTELIAIGEYGITLISPFPMKPGDISTVDAPILLQIGLDEVPVVKVGSCEKTELGFKIKLNYVGLKESQAKIIRQFCRKRWATERQDR